MKCAFLSSTKKSSSSLEGPGKTGGWVAVVFGLIIAGAFGKMRDGFNVKHLLLKCFYYQKEEKKNDEIRSEGVGAITVNLIIFTYFDTR
jgi:hypothetical protein